MIVHILFYRKPATANIFPLSLDMSSVTRHMKQAVGNYIAHLSSVNFAHS
jgi:hypothetical protein